MMGGVSGETWRALRGYGIGIPGEETPTIRITTSAYDNTPASEITALGPLTHNETRLLNQGGAEAVRLDRIFYHKEICHNAKCTDPKHRELKGNETEAPRMVPAPSPERRARGSEDTREGTAQREP